MVDIPSQTGAVRSSPCHVGVKKLFTKNGISVSVGSASAALHYEFDIILDLAGLCSTWNLPDGWNCAYYQPVVLPMKIPDMEEPPVGKEFWEVFWEDLLDHRPPDKELKVYVCCMGGHGRTGTVAVCLLMASQFLDVVTNPIIWLRENYCVEAVETRFQLNYLQSIWDISAPPPKVTPVKTSQPGDLHKIHSSTPSSWEDVPCSVCGGPTFAYAEWRICIMDSEHDCDEAKVSPMKSIESILNSDECPACQAPLILAPDGTIRCKVNAQHFAID